MSILIGISFLLLYAGLVWYIGWSGWRWMRLQASTLWIILYAFTVGIIGSAWMLGFFFENVILRIVGSYWMAIFCVLLLVLPLAQLTVRLLRLTRLHKRRTEQWTGTLALLVAAGFLGLGTYNAYSPVVRSYEIQIDKKTSLPSPLAIVMAADMHFGLLSGRKHAERMVKEINALQPDLVLFPGDMLDDDVEAFTSQGIPEVLRGIVAPLGVYASLGNHDKHEGEMEDIIAAIERGGVTVLYDEVELVAGALAVAGRKDRTERDRAALGELLSGADRSLPLILLEHQPYELDAAQQAGVDLMLSGHTHRGQVAPGNLITRAIYELDWGYLQKEQLHTIVTSGYGFWGPPIRIGTRSELVRILVTFGG